MPYSLFRLSFSTPLHVGVDSMGNALNSSQMCVRSDTVFSAMCSEALKTQCLDELVEDVACRRVSFSDLLPYSGEELYLPKPILYIERSVGASESSADKKAMKKLNFLPSSSFASYIQGLRGGGAKLCAFPYAFGKQTVSQHVAKTGLPEPLPYQVGEFVFDQRCGLYLIVSYDTQEQHDRLKRLMTLLGVSGIGGKRSSGLGKFTVFEDTVPSLLLDMLADHKSPWQMLLGTALPADDGLESILHEAYYQLVRRGGYVASDTYGTSQMKKQTQFMFGRGSCFRTRFDGTVRDVAQGGAHPVWRCAQTLFAGVDV